MQLDELYILLRLENAQVNAGFAESGLAGDRMAEQIAAATSAVSAEMTKVVESTRAVGVSADEMALQWQIDMAKMQAETAKLSAGMATAEAEVAAAAVKTDEALAAQASKFSLLGEASGISNKALMTAGVVAAGAGIEFAKMAGDFQSAITRLNTSAGESKANLQMINDGILQMAGAVGYSSEQLVTAMYKVESGGQHGAAGLKVLQAAAEGAKTENADLTTVADALTSAMTDYKIPADQAATTTSKLVAATAAGKMTFQEMAGSMAAILPIASANHVSLNDILGDLAAMTTHGMSADQATQNLANAVRNLSAPNAVASKELAALGLNATEVSKSLGAQGLSGTINEISSRIQSQMGPDGMVVVNLTNALKGMSPAVQKLGMEVLNGTTSLAAFTKEAKGLDPITAKQAMSFATLAGSMHGIGTEAKSGSEVYQTYTQAMGKAMGGATGLNVALMIGGENAGITAKAIGAVSGATAEAGNHVQGWAEIQGNFNQKLSEAKDGLGALAISVGEKLLPVLTPLVGMLASAANWLAKHQTAAVILAGVLGGALVVGLLAAAAATWTWVAGLLAADVALIPLELPVWALIAAIAALGFIVYEVMAHWSGVAGFFKGVWSAITGAFSAAWGVIKALVSGVYHAFVDPWVMAWDAVKFLFTHSPAEIGAALGRGVGELTLAGWNLIQGLRHGIVDGYHDVVTFFTVTLPNFFTVTVPTFGARALLALRNTGRDILHGLAQGAVDGYHAVIDFFVALPGHVLDFFKAAPGWLYHAGADILSGLVNGFTSMISGIYHTIADFITGFLKGFTQGFGISSPSTVMTRFGGDIMKGLWNGLVNELGNLGRIPGQVFNLITSGFSGAGSWLVSAGYNICVGIYNGIVSGWSMLTNMVHNLASSLINSAKSALGIASPSTVAAEMGRFFALGLAGGIDANASHAVASARALATRVGGALSGMSGNASISVSGQGSAGGGSSLLTSASGGGGGSVINLNVAGHVWALQDLVRELQQELIRHNIRNPTNNTNYSFA